MSDGRERSDADIASRAAPDLQWLASRPLTRTPAPHRRGLPQLDRRSGPPLAAHGPRAATGYPRPPPGPGAQALASELRFATLDAAGARASSDAGAAAHPARAISPHPRPWPRWRGQPAPDRRVLVRPAPGLLRALRVGLCRRDACHGWRAGASSPASGLGPEPQDGYLVVRNANAHAWPRSGCPARAGCTDPTAAVAPAASPPADSAPVPGVLGQTQPTAWRALRAWETVNNRWAQWVLNYSRQNQFDLLKEPRLPDPDWTALGQTIAGVILLLTLAPRLDALSSSHKGEAAWGMGQDAVCPSATGLETGWGGGAHARA